MKPALLLDLGGVILPLNTKATHQKFLKYTQKDIKQWMHFGFPHQLIQQFELGKISEKEFFEELSEQLQFNRELYYLKEAWNAMLMPIPTENIHYLKQLREDYFLILLSNTCKTHIHCFESMLKQHHNIETLEILFDKVYYSCYVGLRKPDPKLFQKVLKDNHLSPSFLTYFDDTPTHIEAAKHLNISSILYPQNSLLKDVLPQYLPIPQKTLFRHKKL